MELKDYLKSHKPSSIFTAKPIYTAEADHMSFFREDVPSYGEPVDIFLTIYRAIDDQRIVGWSFSGAKSIISH